MLIVKGVRTKMHKLNGLNPILAICCSRTEVVVILRDGHTAISLARPRYVHTFSCIEILIILTDGVNHQIAL